MLTYICRLERRVAVVAAAVAGTAVEVVAVAAKAPDEGGEDGGQNVKAGGHGSGAGSVSVLAIWRHAIHM